MKQLILALVAIGVMAVEADACGRFFRCRRTSCVQKQVVVQQQAVVQQQYQQQYQQQAAAPQQVINISNVYPQGQTQYTSNSVASISQLYGANPDLAMTLSARIAENATQTMQAAIASGTASNEAIARVAGVQAVAAAIEAATGHSSGGGGGSVTLQINQTGGGIEVKQINPEGTATTQSPVVDPASSTLVQKCSRCHSGEQPNGGLRFDGSMVALPTDRYRRAMEIMFGTNVPEQMVGLMDELTPDERNEIARELLEMEPQ